jgi:hypothetical protein
LGIASHLFLDYGRRYAGNRVKANPMAKPIAPSPALGLLREARSPMPSNIA